jgi:two-component system chemotaxis response regulator CheV
MSELLKNIDARTRLAGTNKLEILLFSLGKDQRTGRTETFGINVFKVREVMKTPPITAAPDMPKAVKGMVSFARHPRAGGRSGRIHRHAD